MQIADILAQMGGLQSVARDLGVSQSDAATGAEALLPAILGGFKKQACPPSWAASRSRRSRRPPAAWKDWADCSASWAGAACSIR